ncbi:hypothetical protein GCM10027436_74030 [Actinophytocola sediminis]
MAALLVAPRLVVPLLLWRVLLLRILLRVLRRPSVGLPPWFALVRAGTRHAGHGTRRTGHEHQPAPDSRSSTSFVALADGRTILIVTCHGTTLTETLTS